MKGHKYIIKSKIAETQRAKIWYALCEAQDGRTTDVILHTIYPQPSETASFEELFKKECRNAMRIRHPNLVSILDYGQSDGRYYIASEYTSGYTVQQVVSRLHGNAKLVPLWFLIHVLIEVCDGLHYGHCYRDPRKNSNAVTHRFIHPGKIFVTFKGDVKVEQFGLARIVSYWNRGKTSLFHDQFLYTSPELLRGEKASAQSDIYALGVILYQMITGYYPFTASTPIELLKKIESTELVPPASICPWIPPALDTIMMKTLAIDKKQRYQEAKDVSDDLFAFIKKYDPEHDKVDIGLLVSSLFIESPSVAMTTEQLHFKQHGQKDSEQPITEQQIGGSDSNNHKLVKNAVSHAVNSTHWGYTYNTPAGPIPSDIQDNELPPPSVPSEDGLVTSETKEYSLKEYVDTDSEYCKNDSVPLAMNADSADPSVSATLHDKNQHCNKQGNDMHKNSGTVSWESENGDTAVHSEISKKPVEKRMTIGKDILKIKDNRWSIVTENSDTQKTRLSDKEYHEEAKNDTPKPCSDTSITMKDSLNEKENGPKHDQNLSPLSHSALWHFEKGLESVRQKLYTEALHYFETACKEDPDNSIYKINLRRLHKILENNNRF